MFRVLTLIGVACAFAVSLCGCASDSKVPYLSASSWTTEGSFVPSTLIPTSLNDGTVPDQVFREGEFYNSLSYNRARGRLTSPPFVSPPILSFPIVGFPRGFGNEIDLERLDTGERLALTPSTNPGQSWSYARFQLPVDWVGKRVALHASQSMSLPDVWLGVGPPNASSRLAVLAEDAAFTIELMLVFALAFGTLFVAPAVLVLRFAPQRIVPAALSVPVALIGLSLVAEVLFFSFVLSRFIGIAASALAFLALWFAAIRFGSWRALRVHDVLYPLVLAALSGLGCLAVLCSVHGGTPEQLAEWRFLDFPVDNIVPKIFADRLLSGADPRVLLGDTLSSDRPPLQTGLYLLFAPLVMAVRQSGIVYQVISTVLQTAWIPATYGLVRSGGITKSRALAIVAAASLSGFFLINTTFTWPKLLSAGLFLTGLAFVVRAILLNERFTRDRAVLAAFGAALALLAHGGIVFTLPAAVAIAVLMRPGRKVLIAALGAFLIVVLPWSAYQRFYNPPGDRLIKWHFAGVRDKNDVPALRLIEERYAALTAQQIIDNHVGNVRELVSFSGDDVANQGDGFGAVMYRVRGEEFLHTFNALGVFNIGWLFVPLIFIRRERPLARVLIDIIIPSLLFWVLVMFGPATTIVHQGSYATQILLFVLVLTALTSAPRLVAAAVIALEVALFVTAYFIATPYTQFPGPSAPYWLAEAPDFAASALAIVTFAAIVALTFCATLGGKLDPRLLLRGAERRVLRVAKKALRRAPAGSQA